MAGAKVKIIAPNPALPLGGASSGNGRYLTQPDTCECVYRGLVVALDVSQLYSSGFDSVPVHVVVPVAQTGI